MLGLWGILVFGPWVRARTSSRGSTAWFGFLPIFSGDPSQAGVLPAALVLTIMIIPITSAICRELFSRVPRDLSDGSLALGSTRWEAIRRVALPVRGAGHLGRRPARARAGVRRGHRRHAGDRRAATRSTGRCFPPGDTLASRIASTYQGASNDIEVQSLLYLGAILLVISLITNVCGPGRS